jgi:hypothetical protein
MSLLLNPYAFAAAAYTIENSCRFNSADSASTIDASTTAGDTDRWNISVWIKLGSGFLGASRRTIIEAHDGSGFGTIIEFYNASAEIDTIRWSEDVSGGNTGNKYTTQRFRDPGAWTHYFFRWDSGNGVAADRQQIFVNGVRITAFQSSGSLNINVDQGQNSQLFDGVGDIRIGDSNADRYFDGYMAEFIATEGEDHEATDFAETDDNGNWVPKDPSTLTFGDEGWWLDFAVAPGTGDGAGTDVSGNANHFADANLAANDKTNDSPSDDADNDIGNYCTLNPLDDFGTAVLSNGNLITTNGGNTYSWILASQAMPLSGKWVCEITRTAGTYGQVGIMEKSIVPEANQGTPSRAVNFNVGNTERFVNGSSSGSMSTAPLGSVMRLEYDVDEGQLEVFDDGSSVWTETSAGLDAKFGICFGVAAYAATFEANFGAVAFVGTPTSGFKALCTANFPAPTITDPSKYFQVDTFTGTGSELVRTLTDAEGLAVKPDFVRIKDTDTTVPWE